jgi:hypothetical protein
MKRGAMGVGVKRREGCWGAGGRREEEGGGGRNENGTGLETE